MTAATPSVIEAHLWELLSAVADALDIPHAATGGGERVRGEVLGERVLHATLTLRRVGALQAARQRGQELGPDDVAGLVWEIGYLRERLAEVAPVGYVTHDEARAALAAGLPWMQAVDPDVEARWWSYYDLHSGSGPVDAARRATAAVFGVDPSALVAGVAR